MEVLGVAHLRDLAAQGTGCNGVQPAQCIGIADRRLQQIRVLPYGRAGLDAKIDSAGRLIGEVDLAKSIDAPAQESGVVFWIEQSAVGVEKFRSRGIDVDAPVAFDVQCALDVENVEGGVVAERDGARTLA